MHGLGVIVKWFSFCVGAVATVATVATVMNVGVIISIGYSRNAVLRTQ